MLPVTLLNDRKACEIQGGVMAKKAVALLTKFADSLCSLLYKGWKEKSALESGNPSSQS